jgi:hypothetical protein
MKAHRSLRNVVLRARESVGVDRREPSARRVRAQLAGAIVLPSLALVGLSAVAAAWPAPGIDSHVRVSTSQAASSAALRAHDVAARPCPAGATRWMDAKFNGSPWMYAKVNASPWMYAKVNASPWMYAKVNASPWMYAVIKGRPGCTRHGQVTRHGPLFA